MTNPTRSETPTRSSSGTVDRSVIPTMMSILSTINNVRVL